MRSQALYVMLTIQLTFYRQNDMLKVIQGIMRLTGLLSPQLAANLALYLCSKPKRHPYSDREETQLHQAQKIFYKGALGTNNIAWSWGKGPIVILCHGWEARGSKMATLATAIARLGFQAIAIDCTAHGHSSGKQSNFDVMARDIHSLTSQFPHIFAIVGHSMGGMMAMRAREFGVKAERYVLLGAPSAPLPIIDIIKNILKLSPNAITICQNKIADQIGFSWPQLLAGKIYTNADAPLMMIYDTQDEEVPLFHAEKIQSIWKNSTLIKTSGLGHRKLIWDPDVIQSIMTFITSISPSSENNNHKPFIPNSIASRLKGICSHSHIE